MQQGSRAPSRGEAVRMHPARGKRRPAIAAPTSNGGPVQTLGQFLRALTDAHDELLHAAEFALLIVNDSVVHCGCEECIATAEKLSDAIAQAKSVTS